MIRRETLFLFLYSISIYGLLVFTLITAQMLISTEGSITELLYFPAVGFMLMFIANEYIAQIVVGAFIAAWIIVYATSVITYIRTKELAKKYILALFIFAVLFIGGCTSLPFLLL
jgi:hypothetical protein